MQINSFYICLSVNILAFTTKFISLSLSLDIICYTFVVSVNGITDSVITQSAKKQCQVSMETVLCNQ